MGCEAELHIADDHGDNHATMICQLKQGHNGHPHEERFDRGGEVVVTWLCDDRKKSEGDDDDQ